MKSIQVLFILIFGITSQITFGQFTDEINSNRPGKSMMAYAVGKKIIQTETGVTYVSEDHDLLEYQAKGFIGELAIRYGVWKEELEVIADIQYQSDKLTVGNFEEKRNGFKQLTLGAKYLIYDPFKNYVEKENIYSWKANKKIQMETIYSGFFNVCGSKFQCG